MLSAAKNDRRGGVLSTKRTPLMKSPTLITPCPNSAARHVYFVRIFDTVNQGRKSGETGSTGITLQNYVVDGSFLLYLLSLGVVRVAQKSSWRSVLVCNEM